MRLISHTAQPIILFKGCETYVILYDHEHAREAQETVGRWAGDGGLSFSWFDAAACSARIKAELDQCCKGR